MERSLPKQQSSVKTDTKLLWDHLKENNKSNLKVNVWAVHNQFSTVWLSDCDGKQQYL